MSEIPRTPEKGKRVLSDSAPLNPNEKRQKSDDVAPAWDEKLFATIEVRLSDVDANLTSVNQKLSKLEIIEERCDDMENYIAKNADDIAEIRADIKSLREENV